MAATKSAKNIKSLLTDREREIIREAATAAYSAGLVQSTTRSTAAYSDTEKRIYNLPVLKAKVENDRDKLVELQTDGSPMRSASVVRHNRSGSRLKPDEIIDALIQDITAQIAANKYEIETVEKALTIIEKDPYYNIIPCLYFYGMSVEETGGEVACDRSTVFRHRTRLVQRVSVFLYGVDA